jgi:transposase, IS5 family
MNQLTFSEAEYQHKKRKTRREKFLEQMDTLIPWKRLGML